MARYAADPTLEAVAKPLIDKHHPNLKMIKIAYLFREEASISMEKVVAGMAIKCSDRDFAIHKTDAIIEIARDIWDESPANFREALMDHELSHIKVVMDPESDTPKMDEMTMKIKIQIIHHDIEEFEGVLERHGAYHKNLRTFLEAWPARKEEQKKAKKAGMTAGTSEA